MKFMVIFLPLLPKILHCVRAKKKGLPMQAENDQDEVNTKPRAQLRSTVASASCQWSLIAVDSQYVLSIINGCC